MAIPDLSRTVNNVLFKLKEKMFCVFSSSPIDPGGRINVCLGRIFAFADASKSTRLVSIANSEKKMLSKGKPPHNERPQNTRGRG